MASYLTTRAVGTGNSQTISEKVETSNDALAIKLLDDATRNASTSSNDFPKLEGSQKQIEWAEDIRDNSILNLDNVASFNAIEGRDIRDNTKITYRKMTEERQDILKEIPNVRKALINVFKTQKSASKFIDSRDLLLDLNYVNDFVKRISQTRKLARQRGHELSSDLIEKGIRNALLRRTWE